VCSLCCQVSCSGAAMLQSAAVWKFAAAWKSGPEWIQNGFKFRWTITDIPQIGSQILGVPGRAERRRTRWCGGHSRRRPGPMAAGRRPPRAQAVQNACIRNMVLTVTRIQPASEIAGMEATTSNLLNAIQSRALIVYCSFVKMA
jgi:hypothetical protein